MKTMNVNENVMVKLKESGYAILQMRHERLAQRVPKLRPWSPPKEDADGYVKFQLWEFMQIFGEHLYLGGEVPFDTDIRLP